MYKSIKIADTTREERIEIIKTSLAYIDGEKEIAQINMEFRSGLVK